MKKESGRRWLIAAVAFFLLLLAGWVLLALQLTTALAGPLPFAPRLMSNLRADYGPDAQDRPIAVISLSILEDAMQALGLTEDEAAAVHESMELAMSQPVPTATAMDFEGAAPHTATPTVTNTPIPTETRTSLPTNTRPPPTRTPTPSKTPVPTNPPASPAPTSIASSTPSGVDTTDPVVDASGAVFSPAPGDLYSCILNVSNVVITDAAGSSGILDSDVGIKYDPGPGYIFLSGMTGVGGFQLDTSWLAVYSGSFTLSGITPPPGTATPSPGWKKSIDVYVWARDVDGNYSYFPSDFDFDVYVVCP